MIAAKNAARGQIDDAVAAGNEADKSSIAEFAV